MKLENILLEENFDVKIIDFGFSKEMDGVLTSKMGTAAYMAPEMLKKNPEYIGTDIDLFAAVVILFMLISKSPPFTDEASAKDPFYSLIKQNKMNKFWEAHEKTKPKGFYSKDFKSLINCMLNDKPHMRMTLSDLIAHPWMQGPIASKAEVRAELLRRK